ncbi:MAG: hypothetical protein KGL39_28080 [Patescibacteria group bacterium]|nr:hypothetical protein [Patescibacteria group bacterium]
MQFTHSFADDLKAIDWFSRQPFALVRFADGERSILERREIPTADGWRLPSESFRLALQAALTYPDGMGQTGCYHVGISCPCCDAEAHRWYLDKFAPKEHSRLTFSNLFANANWEGFLERCRKSPPRSVGWVGPYPVDALPKFLYPVAWVPRNLVNEPRWSDKVNRIVDKMLHEAAHGPILVSAGPAAKIIVHRFWEQFQYDCDRPCVIDIGSALDPYIHGAPRRGYQTQKPEERKVCVWS